MRPILTVTTPAEDRTLITEAEARQAINVSAGQDDKVLALRQGVSAAIVTHCAVWSAGAVPATLRYEVFSQQIRLDYPVEQIRLVRRPVASIESVIEDGVTLQTSDYELDASTGLLRRLCNDYPAWWSASKIVVAYSAGWAAVPDNLRTAAMKLATALWSEAGRASNLKREEIPDLIMREYWVGPSDDPLLNREIEDLLAEYKNPVMA